MEIICCWNGGFCIHTEENEKSGKCTMIAKLLIKFKGHHIRILVFPDGKKEESSKNSIWLLRKRKKVERKGLFCIILNSLYMRGFWVFFFFFFSTLSLRFNYVLTSLHLVWPWLKEVKWHGQPTHLLWRFSLTEVGTNSKNLLTKPFF